MRSVKYIALVLAAALLLAMLPLPSLAEDAVYDVWVNGTRVTEANAAGIRCGVGNAVYDPAEGVLTLTDASLTKLHEEAGTDDGAAACIYAAGDLTVRLAGENNITAVFSLGHNMRNCGVWCGGKLTIVGTGTLNVTGGLSTYQTMGVYAGSLVIADSVTVNASGGKLTSNVATMGCGLYAENDITFTENAAVYAVSFQPDSDFFPSMSTAIYAGGAVTMEKNANVRAIANRSANEDGDALLLRGFLTVTGGRLWARAVGENGYGIRSLYTRSKPARIESGFIFACGGKHAVLCSTGTMEVNPEYRVTGSAVYNASEQAATAGVSDEYKDGFYYVVETNSGILPAKSVYFVRPVVAYGLWVGGTEVTNYNRGDIFGDGKAAYDNETHTLTLNGAQINMGRHENAYIYAGEALTLRLADGTQNTVGTLSHEAAETAFGIYAANGLTITGGGTLTVAAGDALTDSFGVYSRIGQLSVSGSTVYAKAGDAVQNSIGLYAASEVSGDILLTQMASVSGGSGKAAVMIGVSANGGISVTEASSLSGKSGDNGEDPDSVSYGVRCNGAMALEDSASVTGTGGDAGKFSIGVYVLSSADGVTVKSGRLIARSGSGSECCYGLYAKTSVTVKGGELTAESAAAADTVTSLSYAVTVKTAAFAGGKITVSAGKGGGSCGIFADKTTVSGSAEITASSWDGPKSHAMRKAPVYTSYAPVVHAGAQAPGELVESPVEATYVNRTYVKIEKLFRSEKAWYALPIYDAAGKHGGRWVAFLSDDVTQVAEIGGAVDGTGAAEYHNGYIYGVTSTVPFKFWRVKLDGTSISAPEFISDSVRFSFGDMSYDYVSDRMYGLGDFNTERAIFTIDLNTGDSRRVSSVTGTDAELLTIAFNREGDCYGVDLAGYLYKIYVINGKTEKIGFTGIVPDGAQSMAFDRDTNELFWAYYNGKTGKSGFCYVDIETGKTINAGQIGGTSMELAGLITVPKAYDIWIGGVRVNEDNYTDVFGNRLVSFDPDTSTLTFNGMKITTFAQAYKNYSFGVIVRDMDVNLVFNGENAIALEGVYTDYSASICVVNGKAKITGGKLTILSTDARLDNTILCPDGLTVEGCELLVYSNHNGITVNADGADINIKDSTVGVQAEHIGISATGGSIHIENSTVGVTADKDDKVKACAAACADRFVLTGSVFIATADTNYCVIAPKTEVTESTLEVTGSERALSGRPAFSHKNGTAVTVAHKMSEEEKAPWDKATPLTSYQYVKIAPCTHTYSSDDDTECDICGHIRFLTPGAEEYIPGDPDRDGKVTSADARLALRRSVKLEDYPEDSAPYYACDADHDGNVTSADARLILRASVGLEEI